MVTKTDWGYVIYNIRSDDVEMFESNLTEEVAREHVKNYDLDSWRSGNKDWKIAVIHFVEVRG